jgi:hypothetical protein
MARMTVHMPVRFGDFMLSACCCQSRRIQDRVRLSASTEAAESRQGASSQMVTSCQRAQPGQRTVCSIRSGWISIRVPQHGHRLWRRGSSLAARMICANNAPLASANGIPRIGDLVILPQP